MDEPHVQLPSSKVDTVALTKRVHIIALATLALLSLGTTFQLAIVVNRVYRLEHGAVSISVLLFCYIQELILVFYVFVLFWLVRRPNVMIATGGIIGICTIILIITLIASAFRHEAPLAVGTTLRKVNLYFACKLAFCFIAQLGCGYLVYVSLYAFPKAFRFDVSYLSLLEEDNSTSKGTYVPPTSDSDSIYDEGVMLDDVDSYRPSILMSDSRDTASM